MLAISSIFVELNCWRRSFDKVTLNCFSSTSNDVVMCSPSYCSYSEMLNSFFNESMGSSPKLSCLSLLISYAINSPKRAIAAKQIKKYVVTITPEINE